jgi:DNA-binding MarR family transcriptional regulator
LNWDGKNHRQQFTTQKVDLTTEEQKILISIAELPGITPGEVSKLLGIPLQNILAMLLEMELKEWISRVPGNRYQSRMILT